jgi:hypothetical protein
MVNGEWWNGEWWNGGRLNGEWRKRWKRWNGGMVEDWSGGRAEGKFRSLKA